MNKKNLKIIGLVALLFLIDIIRPLGYHLLINLNFLALIAISLYCRMSFSLLISLFAGFSQDKLIFPSEIFYSIEYPLIVLAVFFLNNLLKFVKIKSHPLVSKAIIAALLILAHSFLNLLRIESNSFSFLTVFFIQSYFIFFIVDNAVQKLLLSKGLQPANRASL